MKTTILASLLAASSLSVIALPASAQAFLSLNQRQVQLDTRIDAGVRQGDLTRAEAARLRAEFRELTAVEAQYRRTAGGLDARERADLERRYDLLSARVRSDREDDQERDFGDSEERQDELTDRIEQGAASGDLTRVEAQSLRRELRALVRLESDFERSGGGLDARERADLRRRYDALSDRLRFERRDDEGRDDRDSYVSLESRRADLERRIEAGTRRGDLNLLESVRIRAEFAVLLRQENNYRNSGGGLDAREQEELSRRYDALSARLRDDRRDDDRRL